MARLADAGGVGGYGDVYHELLEAVEQHWERRGWLLLIKDGMVSSRNPSPLLRQLRAGEPVEIPDWMLPRWARPQAGKLRGTYYRVHPSGLVEELS